MISGCADSADTDDTDDTDDSGGAIIEFCYLALLLMVPLVYVVLVVFQIQRAGYAVTHATREAARAYVTADRRADAESRAYAAAWLALRDHGIELQPGQLRIECGADEAGSADGAGRANGTSTAIGTTGTTGAGTAGGCLRPGSQVLIRIDTAVALPLAPPFFADRAPASIAIHGLHEEMVDAYRTLRP